MKSNGLSCKICEKYYSKDPDNFFHCSCALMLIQKGASVNEKVVNEALNYEERSKTDKRPEPHIWVWKQAKPVEVKEKKEFSIFQVCYC